MKIFKKLRRFIFIPTLLFIVLPGWPLSGTDSVEIAADTNAINETSIGVEKSADKKDTADSLNKDKASESIKESTDKKETPENDKKDKTAVESTEKEKKEPSSKSWPLPGINGFLETAVYIYSTEKEDLSATETNSRIHENILLNFIFMENLSFHTSNRVTFRSDENEAPERWDFNLYYGYINYDLNKNINMQLGRIMDINNLIFSYYDGGNFEYKIKLLSHRIAMGVYGGFIVNDDYLEEEEELLSLNNFDYRNLFVEQRAGDYIAGAKVNYIARKIGIFNLDYQVIFNNSALAEHYLSVDFDTMFSKKVKFFGNGTFDLIEPLPSNALFASQLDFIDFLSVIIEYEYYRPVFIKESFFWSYFKPYGNHEVSGLLIFMITQLVTVDLKYGKIFYDSVSETGDEVSISFEHRRFYYLGIKLDAEYIRGPEGDKVSLQAVFKRRIIYFNALLGGGIIFYNEDELTDAFSKGYYAMLGADIRILDNLILAINGELYSNPQYQYNMRADFSVKYLFFVE